MSGGRVTAANLAKHFGSVRAVEGLSFSIKDGEFFTFLGPSGCGKTTTLRMLAGFHKPTSGRIEINDQDITKDPPYRRDVGMVFQSYALFPHKTVGENVGFGLKMEGMATEKRNAKIGEALEMVDLNGYRDRQPADLSGGQQQRVALARALVIEPDVLLLDEPLANLDLKLRQQMRFELKRIQDDLGITTVYVTHDQQEALSMSDRVMVMNNGRAEQIAAPEELYHEPTNEFVANFIGETNLLTGKIDSYDQNNDLARVSVSSIGTEFNASTKLANGSLNEGKQVKLNLRPEDISISESTNGSGIAGTIAARTFHGQVTTYLIEVGEEEIRVDQFGQEDSGGFGQGKEVEVTWGQADCMVLGDSQ